MSLDLTNIFVIGMSATALFNMSESDRLFQETTKTTLIVPLKRIVPVCESVSANLCNRAQAGSGCIDV